MEGWQKGAPAVLKFSSAGKQKYFKQFPERESWFKQNYPEHFGRSVTAATTSLKKTNTAKKQQQRLAAIRQAASKRDQLKVSSAAVQAMGARRREGGEGLGGGLETNRDIIAHARAGGTISSGGLGSLFEDKVKQVKDENGKTMYEYNGVQYKTVKEANKAQKDEQESNAAATRQILFPGLSALDKIVNPLGVDIPKGVATLSSGAKDLAQAFISNSPEKYDEVKKRWQQSGLLGRDWPEPGQDPTWDADMYMRNKAFQTDQNLIKQLQTDFSPPRTDDLSVTRKPFRGRSTPDAERPDLVKRRNPDSEDYKGMYYEENELKGVAKTLAERIVTNKLQECMPEESKWDNLEAWEQNPIPRGVASEAEDEPGEYDYEGDMAKSQLRSIAYNAKMLHDMLEDNTNLPEWVQSKITLAEDYMLTAANYMRGEMDRMDEATSFPAGGGVINYDPKWEKSEAEGTANLGDEQPPFDPSPNRPEMDPGKHPEGFRRARQLARQALKAKIASMQQPAAAEDLVAQHNAIHQTVAEQAEQNQLIDQSVANQLLGFEAAKGQKVAGREKVLGKKEVEKKKKPVNPSENELVPQSMLPDVPGYPAGYKPTPNMEESVESESPYVKASATFLTKTSPRVVYGDKND